MQDLPIGIFDSGIGGLTVAKEIIENLPHESIIYLGDTARVPYGPRDLEEVKTFVFEIVEFLVKQSVKLIIIACNTGTAAGLQAVQTEFDMPIIGVIEPGARGAFQVSASRRIGVVATSGTVQSCAYENAVRYIDAGAQVFSQACPELVDFVERGETEGEHIEKVISWYVNPLKTAKVDTLILGCTHYPLLTEVFGKVMGADVRLISSAKETAREVREILTRRCLLSANMNPVRRYIATAEPDIFRRLGTRFLSHDLGECELVTIEELASNASRLDKSMG